jgi:methionine-gamma-lyase
MSISSKGFSTRCIHGNDKPCPVTGSLVPPIYQTSTFVFPDAATGKARFAGEEEGYIYTRLGNPTVDALDDRIALLEGGEAGASFASGMGAVSAVLLTLIKTGDHILATNGLYGCTFGLLDWLKEKFGVQYDLIDMTVAEEVEKHIRPETKVIYIETPINPTMKLVDLEKVSVIAKRYGVQVVVDNTFMTPYFQRPLDLGVDIVVHSATKYIGGHGDVVAGLVVGRKEFIRELKLTAQKDVGAILGPFDAWLLLRGLKTLALRMDRHNENGMKVAQFLKDHPQVDQVYYPGLPDHPQYELALKQMKGFGGIITFEVKGGYDQGVKVMNEVRLAMLAVSLGDVDTLIQHPASMTHAIIPKENRSIMGITDGMVRLSVGLEDVEDIIADLKEALEK